MSDELRPIGARRPERVAGGVEAGVTGVVPVLGPLEVTASGPVSLADAELQRFEEYVRRRYGSAAARDGSAEVDRDFLEWVAWADARGDARREDATRWWNR